MRKIILTLFTVLCCTVLSAQNNFFTDVNENAVQRTSGKKITISEKHRTVALALQGMKNFLWSLPLENNIANRNQSSILELPLPYGGTARYRVWESSVMEPGLAVKFSGIRTFSGQGIDDPTATISLDWTELGFHAMILSGITGNIFIDPYQQLDKTNYTIYFKKDFKSHESFICETAGLTNQGENVIDAAGVCVGTQLRTFRLALACTGEYAVAVCPPGNVTIANTLSAMVTSVNRVTGVYEKDVAVRLTLISNTDQVIYLDAVTDPFTNTNGVTMLGQNQTNMDAVIGSANYDIGHVFSTGGGGVAGLGVVCNNGAKARGVTGRGNPVGDPFDIDYVAHEMGHQFGGNHTFNATTGFCNGNRNGSTAVEPGSGVTIMGYAGICNAANDLAPNSIDIFHGKSLDEIGSFVNAISCQVTTPTGNSIPSVNAGADYSIPVSTPFSLTGSATDPNAGDVLTYCWEQMDIGPSGNWNAPTGNAPLFRSFVPTTSGTRFFPKLSDVINNTTTIGELLPSYARNMVFRLTVRDNKAGGGGVCADEMQIAVVNGGGPFAVTVPNGGESYFGASSQTITWNVVGTDAAPINVANVKISLSTDGGLTYPAVIAASTPNDGSEVVTIPAVVSATARIKVEAIGNIFFDISNANFTINAVPNGFTFNSPAPVVSACPAAATMQTTLTATYTGSFTTNIALTATVNPAGPTVTFGTNPLTTGSSNTTVTLNGTNILPFGSYVVTVTGTAGAIVQTRDITFTINASAGPAIGTQPSPQIICAGADATFTVAATGTYQWQVSTAAVPAFTNIGGAVSASYTVSGAAAGLNGNQYRCVVSSQCGSTNSNPAALTVNTAPVVTAQPQSVILCAGSNNTFTVSASGAGITYQWQISTTAVPAFTNIGGATSATYTVNGITAGMNGDQYRCVVSGTCTPAATSNAATLAVVSSVTVTGQPANTAVCDGGNINFSVTGSGAGIIYQWQVNPGTGFVNITNGAPYSGATSATLAITGATTSLNNYQFRCQLSNATCSTPGVSNAATLTVNTLPAISASPVAVTICVASNNTFSVTATGTGITYQWQMNTAAAPTFVDIATATANTYTVSSVTAGMNGNQYRCIVTGTCAPPAISSAAILTVISPVVVTTQPVNSEICSGSNTSFTVAGNSSQTISYQWQVSTAAVPAFTNIAGATAATLSLTAATTGMNGNQYRCQLSNTTCTAPVASNAATLTVRQLPTVGLAAAPYLSLLPGQSTTLTATPSAQTTGTLTTSWFKNGTAITNAGNTRIINVENAGTYRIDIQEVFSTGRVCSNQSANVVIDATVSNKLFIFPSPNDGQFTVSYYNNGGTSTSRTVTVYDSKGDRVRHKKFTVSGPYTLLGIDIRGTQKGIYYVVVGDANGKVLANGKVAVQ
jgi:Metallo-peptidase family M12B Reprolysin-like/Secretion system C-terminal sorting domain